MKLTEAGLELIKQFEGFRALAYRDAVGVWTIGFGHTSMAGAPQVTPGLQISKTEGDEILARDAEQFADGVRKQVTVELSDAQFSALVSFGFNVGLGNLKKSSVLAAVNRSDFAAVPRRLQMWTKAGGKVLLGLVRRRAAEAALFVSDAPTVQAGPIEKAAAKPVQASKTVWSAAAVMLLSVFQAWLTTSLKLTAIVVLLLTAAGLGLIIFERVKKLKQEGL